jgi:hypothetical protein
MADTVDTITMFNGTRKLTLRLFNDSDGTGESAVKKVDASTYTGPDGTAPACFVVEEIEWNVNSLGSVTLLFDATTDDELDILSGSGYKDYRKAGGLKDPQSTGTTGDILLTTNDFVAGDSYDITLYLRLKDD